MDSSPENWENELDLCLEECFADIKLIMEVGEGIHPSPFNKLCELLSVDGSLNTDKLRPLVWLSAVKGHDFFKEIEKFVEKGFNNE